MSEIEQLKQAIDCNDVDRFKTLMTNNPGLHQAPVFEFLVQKGADLSV